MNKPVLYIDVDDTIIAQHDYHLGFDLRPYVMSQLRMLTDHFHCRWLTCVSEERTKWLLRLLYAAHIQRNIEYANWGHGDPLYKAGYVLHPDSPADFWWLEDPILPDEAEALKAAGKYDRWICVNRVGPHGFTEAIRELFKRAGIQGVSIPGEDLIR